MKSWNNRSPIIANLFNPAYCGEIIRRTAESYYKNCNKQLPYAYSFLILPILLHKSTRQKLPKSTRKYLFTWVEENDFLFIDFTSRVKNMKPFTKEAISFLIANNKMIIDNDGGMEVFEYRKKNPTGNNIEETQEIFRKAKLLGSWFAISGDVKSIYSFFRITP